MQTTLTLLKVEWVPNSQVLLAVTTSKFVKVYDLSRDVISPLHNWTANKASLSALLG